MFYNGIFISEASLSVNAGAQRGAIRLAIRSFGRGTTGEWEGITEDSGVQWVKTLITLKRNTCVH